MVDCCEEITADKLITGEITGAMMGETVLSFWIGAA